MAQAGDSPPKRTDYEPNFEFPRYGAITEENWQAYAARGFVPVPQSLDSAQMMYGVAHVYTGDEYDYEAERPLRHKPGTGIYVSPEGLAFSAEQAREWDQWHREHRQAQDPTAEPGSN